MEGNHVVGWLFAVFLMLGALHGQETRPGAERLELEARQLAGEGKHAESARRWEGVAGVWQQAGKKAEASRAWESASREHEEAAAYASALTAAESALRGLRELHTGHDDAELAKVINRTGCLLAERLGQPRAGLQRAEEALAMRKRLFAGDHRDVADSLSDVASCLDSLGRSTEALPRYEEALAMRKRLFLGDHPSLATSLHNLAYCLQSLGQSTEALSRFEEALAMQKRLFCGDHPDVAMCLNNVSQCLRSLGRSTEALPRFEEALAMRKRLFPGNHPDVAGSLNSVALCLKSLGRSTEALSLHEEALAMTRRLFPGDHPDTATFLNNVALCLNSVGRSTEALSLHEEALAMRNRLFRADHSDVAQSLNNMASCLQLLGQIPEALARCEEALAMRKRLFCGDHSDVAQSLNNVAMCLQSLGRITEALPRFEQALAMQKRLFAGDHPDMAMLLNNVAQCLQLLGQSPEALLRWEETLAMQKRLFAGDHPDVALCLNNVAMCFQSLGWTTEALLWSEEALAMQKRLFAGDHPDVAALLNNVAACLEVLGRRAEAVPRLEEALAMSKRLYPGDHPAVALSLNNMAWGLWALGRIPEALPMFQEAVVMQKRLFPGDHPDTVRCLGNLADLRLSAKAASLAKPLLLDAIQMLEGIRGASRDLEESDRSAYLGKLGAADLHDLMRRCQLLLGEPTEALRYSESGRTRELLQRLENSRFDALAEAERRAGLRGDNAEGKVIAEVRGRLERAETGYGALVHQLTKTASDLKISAEERKQRLAEIEGRMAEADAARTAALRERARHVADVLKIAEPASPEQLAAMLQAGELLLFFCLDDEGQSCAFTVDHDQGHRVVPLPAAQKAVDEQLRQHLVRLSHGQTTAGRGILSEPLGKGDAASAGRKLSDALLPGALWDRIASHARVYIVPGDTLARLPFETLPVAKSAAGKEQVWLDVGPPIAYSPSGSVLRWLRDRAGRQQDDVTRHTVVALGDPVFLAQREPEYPETGALIARITPGSQAEKIGLRARDTIVSYGGAKVASDAGFRDATRKVEDAIEAGERQRGPVPLRLWRQGEELELQVEPGPLGVLLGRGNAREAHALGYGDGNDEQDRKLLLRDAELRNLGNLRRLPGTAAECTAIAKAFAGTDDLERALASLRVKVLLGERATEANLFESAPRATYLHLATHGIADEVAQASFSALAVTMPAQPGPDDNGFLDLHDLLHHWRDRLSSCRMVVLSACRTSVGPQKKGEAIQALPIGFFYAGASSVIASLWSVDDASTAVLMADFYRRLAKPEGAADRLQSFWDARKALRLDPRYADPFHWAAFLYFGSPR